MKTLAKLIYYPCWILEIYFTYAITDKGKVKIRFCRFSEFEGKVPNEFWGKIASLKATYKSEDLYEMPWRYAIMKMKFYSNV